MYNIHVRTKTDNKAYNSYVAGDLNDLFELAYMLNKYEMVKEFRVYYDCARCRSSDFGWGAMEKWVIDWDWSK